MPNQIADDSRQIFNALAHGVAGNHTAAQELLLPILKRSELAMYATLCVLAEAAATDALQQRHPGEHFGIKVEHIATGAEANTNVLPPGVRFAAQFTTAHANRDPDTTHALYRALYEANPDDLTVGIRALYDMAITSLRAVVDRRRSAS